MENKKNSMVGSAMNYAIPLGLLWAFSYLFIILGDYSERCKYIHDILRIGTPIVYYILICRYRDIDRGGKISFGDCILFTLLLFLFGSLFETVVICLHIYIVNPGTVVLINFHNEMLASLQILNKSFNLNKAVVTQTEASFSNIRMLFITSNIWNNVFLGLLFSLICGYFVSKKTTKS